MSETVNNALERRARRPKTSSKPKHLDGVEAEVGRRIRTHRMAKGVSQQELGSALGVTFQQIQKYERGENRISLGHLQKIADRFGLPIATFCECMEKGARGVGAAQTDYSLLQSYGSLKLLRRYNSLAPDVRKVVVRLVDALAAKHSGGNRKALSARWGGTPNAGARRREGG